MLEKEKVSTCLTQDISDKFKELWYVVGNTPMLELCYEYKGNPGSVYVKCEHDNLTGSIKDRVGLYTLYQAYKSCKIKPGDTIIVVSGGDTGISFSAIGKALGHPVKIIIPEGSNEERIFTAVKMGAEVIVVSGEQRSLSSRIKLSEEMALKGDVFLPHQFEKDYDVEAHERTTGKEIWRQLASNGIIADAFVTGVGTGGTIMGTSNYLKMLNPKTKIHPLELADSRNLTNSLTIGNSHIMGAADGFMPTLVKLNELDEIIQVNNADAITMAHMLAEQMELAIGISSGANVVAAIKLKEKMGPTATIVTLLGDRYKKKRQGADLVSEKFIRSGDISAQLTFTGYHILSSRVKEPPI
jgi:cysteine synthase A